MKRGQITVFIVVGILILFAVGFIILTAKVQTGTATPTEESEVQQYIGACLETTLKSALIELGTKGGYMNIPESVNLNERSYFSFGIRTNPKIPLWYYRGEQRIPTRESMENETANYVLSTINSCLKNFDVFKDRYDLQLKENMRINVTIGKTYTFANLYYPLQIEEKRTGIKSEINFVPRQLNVKIGQMYDMAIDILQSENEQLFFENMTMNLLASSKDFPFTGMEFGCNPKIWRKADLINFAKGIISMNAGRVTVVGNRAQLFDTSDNYAKNHFVFKLNNKYAGLDAAFLYPTSSRFELHVRPNDYPVLTSNVGKPQNPIVAALPFCLNTYHFTYDIEYPLLVTLRDNTAFNGEGFLFNFGMPVTINHNQGDKKDFGSASFDSLIRNYDFCTETNPDVVEIRAKDAFTNADIYNAKIDYKCVRYVCELGATKADLGAYRVRAKLPSSCTNGVLMATADGYLPGQVQYTDTQYAEVLMKPVKKLKVNFLKHDSDNFNKVEGLLEGDSAIVFLTSDDDPKFEQMFMSDYPMEFEVIDGDANYNVQALLLQDQERLIGGYVGTLNINYMDIAQASTVTFNLVQKIPIAVTEDEQMAAANYVFTDKSYQEPLKPTFS